MKFGVKIEEDVQIIQKIEYNAINNSIDNSILKLKKMINLFTDEEKFNTLVEILP